jgi:phosphate:Na+ symporter
LELARLGELVLAMVRRAQIVAVNGRQEDRQTLLGQDDEIDRLESAILVYVSRLSQVEHTEEEGRQVGGLAQIANILESIATDMIEHFRQIAHFARRIAEIAKDW